MEEESFNWKEPGERTAIAGLISPPSIHFTFPVIPVSSQCLSAKNSSYYTILYSRLPEYKYEILYMQYRCTFYMHVYMHYIKYNVISWQARTAAVLNCP